MLRSIALLLVVVSTASCGPNGDLRIGDFAITAEECPLTPEELNAMFADGGVGDPSYLWIYYLSRRAIRTGSEFRVDFEYETTTVIESPVPDRLQRLSGGDGWAAFRALREGPGVVVAYDGQDHRLIDYKDVTVRDCSMDGGAPIGRDADVDAP